MMLESDEENDDTLEDLPQPKSKRRREDNVENLASGPTDFIKALVEAGFHPRSGNLPNLLSKQPNLIAIQSITMLYFEGVQQTDFQHSLREHLVNNVQFPRSVEFFVSECDTFLNERENFIKALHPTEVLEFRFYFLK